MKAMVLHAPGPIEERPLVHEDVTAPRPGDKSILVRITACAVCRTDLHLVEGELLPRKTPVIPGHQAVGTVAAVGSRSTRFHVGDRVGIAWLHKACGGCGFCAAGAENLCPGASFTGWHVDGGFAEYAAVPAAFAYSLPRALEGHHVAPLLCAGIVGYRALRACGVGPGQRLGLYGFGASAHIAIQVARHWRCEVYVFTRSEAGRRQAKDLGACWAGLAEEQSPRRLQAAIIFAPAGSLVPRALEALERGGTVALAGICMSPIPELDYATHLYQEKALRSVANATRRDGEELLRLAGEIPIRTAVTTFPLDQANEAMLAVKNGRIRGAAVLTT